MPKKTEKKDTGLDAYINTLVDKASVSGSVSEDEIQIVLKDVDIDDAQLTSIYRSLRDRGTEVVSQGEADDDLSLGTDGVGGSDDDDLGVEDRKGVGGKSVKISGGVGGGGGS